ncbi:ABC transporter substrate-binding protein [Variovorax sp. 2RAF20]|uniref:ABC transporter substrate-binding protein n=1 Tax=Variovorax sp. CF313 TaxID=1144315 RepID=UPI00027127F4|nr:ABC transporter substrate-binding protein [Variovorax sp. CF313]EJL74103.1 periplasmic component of amino acid ABC-type transporter/signal transduction system [Variovorax sp. CF313]
MKHYKSKQTTSGTRSISSSLAAFIMSVVSCAAFAAPDYGKCEVSGERGSVKLETAVPGALSVRPVLPSPGWWNGDSIETIKDGFEYCMAANMAHRAGLDRVIVVNRSFAQILTGQAQGFDIALSQVTITDERKKVVNFTDPYFSSDQGILVKAGVKVDKESIKKMRLGVKQGTTILGYLAEHVKPVEQPKVFTETAPMYAALAAGQVDAVLYDTPNVLARAKQSNGMFEVVGRYDTGERWGGLVNKDSPNMPAFNKLIEEMKRDGTFARLANQYLAPSLGADPSKVPVFNP